MQKIERINEETQEPESIYVFSSEEERERYFRDLDRETNRAQDRALATLARAYMGNKTKISGTRFRGGSKARGEALQKLDREHKDKIKGVFDQFAKTRALIRKAQESSRLESDLSPVP
jgi:hypothetical protein